MAKDSGIELDFSQVFDGLKRLSAKTLEAAKLGLRESGEELLRLSIMEVPFRYGWLQQTGTVDASGIDDGTPEVVIGYNTPYAARLHEHPEYHFGNGRKGKYLEDPLVRNLSVFQQFIQEKINAAL